MNSGTTAPEQLFGYEVMDSGGEKAGKVEGVWVDDATREIEFLGVKSGGLFGGKNHVVPATNAQIDGSAQTIQIPYPKDQMKDAPTFSSDSELSPGDEDKIYSYWGLGRSTESSPSGLPDGSQRTSGYAADTSTGDRTATDETRVPLHEEQLQVGKRQVEGERVRLRKVVRSEVVQQPVELKREDIEIERVPASGEPSSEAFQEGEVEVPLRHEEAVVGKEAYKTGEVRVGKDVTTETEDVGGEIRREDVEVERDSKA